MQFFTNDKARGRLIRLSVCILIIAAIEIVFLWGGGLYPVDDSARRFFRICEGILLLVIITNGLMIIFKVESTFGELVRDLAGRLLKKIFYPLMDKANEIIRRENRLVGGVDEAKLMLNFGIADKLKSALRPRRKIDLRRCATNSERVRMLYIRFILTLKRQRYVIDESCTPREIDKKILSGNNQSGILFDVYENLRYNREDTVTISDETVLQCEKIRTPKD